MNTRITQLMIGMLLVGTLSAAYADGLLKVEQTVFGMDCAPCAYGLRTGLAKLPGVTKADVSLNDGKALIEFAPDSPATFTEIHELIIHSGFTPKEAVVTVQGHIAKAGDHLRLITHGTDQYDLTFSQAGDAASLKPDDNVVIQGQISELASGSIPSLSVQSVAAVNAPHNTPNSEH